MWLYSDFFQTIRRYFNDNYSHDTELIYIEFFMTTLLQIIFYTSATVLLELCENSEMTGFSMRLAAVDTSC